MHTPKLRFYSLSLSLHLSLSLGSDAYEREKGTIRLGGRTKYSNELALRRNPDETPNVDKEASMKIYDRGSNVQGPLNE